MCEWNLVLVAKQNHMLRQKNDNMSMSHGVKLNPQNDIIKVTNGEMQHRLNKLQVTNKIHKMDKSRR